MLGICFNAYFPTKPIVAIPKPANTAVLAYDFRNTIFICFKMNISIIHLPLSLTPAINKQICNIFDLL